MTLYLLSQKTKYNFNSIILIWRSFDLKKIEIRITIWLIAQAGLWFEVGRFGRLKLGLLFEGLELCCGVGRAGGGLVMVPGLYGGPVVLHLSPHLLIITLRWNVVLCKTFLLSSGTTPMSYSLDLMTHFWLIWSDAFDFLIFFYWNQIMILL